MEELNGYFKQVVRDAVKDLKHFGVAYVFYREQVEAVMKLVPDATYNEDDGIYKISSSVKKVGGKGVCKRKKEV